MSHAIFEALRRKLQIENQVARNGRLLHDSHL